MRPVATPLRLEMRRQAAPLGLPFRIAGFSFFGVIVSGLRVEDFGGFLGF